MMRAPYCGTRRWHPNVRDFWSRGTPNMVSLWGSPSNGLCRNWLQPLWTRCLSLVVLYGPSRGESLGRNGFGKVIASTGIKRYLNQYSFLGNGMKNRLNLFLSPGSFSLPDSFWNFPYFFRNDRDRKKSALRPT